MPLSAAVNPFPLRRLALCCLALCCLGLASGCSLPKSKEWLHPRVANPRKEDQLFVEDTKFCEEKIGPALQGEARTAAMDVCYRRLGWQRKDEQ